MEHFSTENIINYALNKAIKDCYVCMVEQCLLQKAIITSESIKNLHKLMKSYLYAPNQESSKRIFKLLLTNGIDIMIDDIDFLYLCLQHHNKFYIKSIAQ